MAQAQSAIPSGTTVYDQSGRLDDNDTQDDEGAFDLHQLQVTAGQSVSIIVESSAFDPILEVTDVDGSLLSNDDWRGSRTTSRVDLVSESAGPIKIRVKAFTSEERGAYRLRVISTTPPRNVANPVASLPVNIGGTQVGQAQSAASHHRLSVAAVWSRAVTIRVGQVITGELNIGTQRLDSGEPAEMYSLPLRAGQTVSLDLESTAFDAYLVVLGPNGERFENDDEGGGSNAHVQFVAAQDGLYRVLATAYQAGQFGSFTLKVGGADHATQPTSNNNQTASSSAGNMQTGRLQMGDRTLRGGQFSDSFTRTVEANHALTVRVASAEFDPYVIVTSPSGREFSNDDLSDNDHTAGLTIQPTEAGTYTITVSSYAAGEAGQYQLTSQDVAGATNNSSNAVVASNTTNSAVLTGSLATGDATTTSGQLFDQFHSNLRAGTRVRFEARSSAFDTVLSVTSPSGRVESNDDGFPSSTNSALEMIATEDGSYTVQVMSFDPGRTGDYEVRVQTFGASAQPNVPAPPANNNTQPQSQPQGTRFDGALEPGDSRLQSGESFDSYPLQFRPGEPVEIALRSNAFDAYLIVRTPSGSTLQNDDGTSNTHDAVVTIPSAEAGVYTVQTTSYAAGEQGPYTLEISRPSSSSLNSSNNSVPDTNTPRPSNGDTAMWTVLVGISDYPGSGNDLADTALDATKLAETLRTRGLSDSAHTIVLTDNAATRANFRAAMARIAQNARPTDTFMLFYSGHGGQGARNNRDPRELDGIDETISLYDGDINDNEMGELFDRIHARLSIIALDSCYSGGFAKDVITKPGRVGYFSSEEDVLSAVASQFRAGGYLSHFLREALAGDADNDPADRNLTVGEVTQYLWRQFATHARDIHVDMGYQRLVVDRGAVGVTDSVFRYPSTGSSRTR